jgi:hypothetical protein
MAWKSFATEESFWEHFSTNKKRMGYDAIQIQMQKDRQALNETHATAARLEFPNLDHPAFQGRKRGIHYTMSKTEAIAKAYRKLKKIVEEGEGEGEGET